MKRRLFLVGVAGMAAAAVAGCSLQKASRWTGIVEHGSASIPNGWKRSVEIGADSVVIHDNPSMRSRRVDDALRRRLDDLIDQAVAAARSVSPTAAPGSAPYTFNVRSSSHSPFLRSGSNYSEPDLYHLAQQIYGACAA